MGIVTSHLYRISASTWDLLRDASPFLLVGFLLAGVVHSFLPTATIVRMLGKRSFASVFWAAVVGVPLPLCSCAVLPVAAQLRKAGADKGAVTAFVIATPESGLDSIATTYSLMDLPMTVARPAAALATALAAGVAENIFGAKEENAVVPSPVTTECNGGCGCDAAVPGRPRPKVSGRVVEALRYSFGEMFEDMAAYLLLGFGAAGVLAALIPPSLIAETLASPTLQVMAMVVLGIPIYVCATAATPVAAVLIAKGVSPGAALAFLLAGPATNAAGIAVLSKYLGRRSVIIYLASIIIMAIGSGIIFNALWAAAAWTTPVRYAPPAPGARFDYLGTAAAVLFSALCLNGLRLKYARKRKASV